DGDREDDRGGNRVRLSISHGRGEGARLADQFRARARALNVDLTPDVFRDANAIRPGQEWESLLRQELSRSSLRAAFTDEEGAAADLQREAMMANRALVPALVVDASTGGARRTLPNLGGIPVIRYGTSDPHFVDSALKILLIETLHFRNERARFESLDSRFR